MSRRSVIRLSTIAALGLAILSGSATAQQTTLKEQVVGTYNRMSETADENKAITQGSLASYGTYTVNEADKMGTLHLDGSTFPNWAGTEQKRPIKSISADELAYTNPAPTTGAGATVLPFKRAK